ncbi:MAG: succinyl-CoA--3-ketoacid-CoA transferase [Actinomycetota bacterium]|nr:MAG: succinyl-CoA--3-ketoacid-CoA transferase [Actinomycetota bacterium]
MGIQEASLWSMQEVAAKVARDVDDRWLVNVGIGLPQVAVEPLNEKHVILHSENGIIGLGPSPQQGEEDPDVIDAGKGFATVIAGGSFIDSATSFTLIRGGRLDLALMGAYEVSINGDLANWRLSGKKIAGIGGAADLAHGARRVWIITNLFANDGTSKLVNSCRHPLTASKVVTRIYTEHGIFEPTGDAFNAVELAAGVKPSNLAERGVPVRP